MIIIDTKVLVSALIKDSVTRKILIEADCSFAYPEIALRELVKHREYIAKKCRTTLEEVDSTLRTLFEYVQLKAQEVFEAELAKAAEIMLKIDPNDTVFIAPALALKAPIWTDDKDFERQHHVKILKTTDLIKQFLKPQV